MKKIFSFTKKKKGFSPNSSDTGSVLSAGYEIKEKDLGKVHKAASSGDLAKLKQLAKKNDLNQLDKENRAPLHIACAHGHSDVVQFLVENKAKLNLCDNQNRSPLMKAVQCQQERCALILLEHNADPNLVDIGGNTALHLAALVPALPLGVLLLEHGANIDAQNRDGCTPLILAVTENHTEMVEFLLKEGANVNAQDLGRRTPLMVAACNGQISLIRLLLTFDADITIKDEKGWTSDDYAVINGHHACSHLIIEHGTQRKSQQSPSLLVLGGKQLGFGSPARGAEAGVSLGRPAANREVDDNSQAESVSRASKSEVGDSWPSSDEEGLDFSPKKPQKLNLKELISAAGKAKKNATGGAVRTWSDHDSEPESEGKVERNPAHPVTLPSSSSSQHPESLSPACISKPPLLTSTPLHRSRKEGDLSENDSEDEELQEEEDEEEDDMEDRDFVTDEKRSHDADNVSSERDRRASEDVKRDFLSELGLEDGADEGDSSWDSSASDSPKRPSAAALRSPVKAENEATRRSQDMSTDFVYIPSFMTAPGTCLVANLESSRSVERPGGLKREGNSPADDLEVKPDVQVTQQVSQLPIRAVTKETAEANKKIDFMEELGLADVDDLEESQRKAADPSDWDSTSTASRDLPAYTETPPPDLKVSPLKEEPDSSPPSPPPQTTAKGRVDLPSLEGGASAGEKGLLSPVPPLVKPCSGTAETNSSLSRVDTEEGQRGHLVEAGGAEKGKDVVVQAELDANRRLCSGGLDFRSEHAQEEGGVSDTGEEESWEKRYEKIWVEPEKREVKSHYRRVAVELKERFGEVSVKVAQQRRPQVAHTCSPEESSEEEEDVKPAVRAYQMPLGPIVEQTESGLEDSLSEPAGALVVEQVDSRSEDSLSGSTGTPQSGGDAAPHGPQVIPRPMLCPPTEEEHLSEHCSNSAEKNLENEEQKIECLASAGIPDVGCEMQPGHRSGTEDPGDFGPAGDGGSHDSAQTGKDEAYRTESPQVTPPLANPAMHLHPSDDELEEDLQRFRHEVGMLKVVFLDLEKEKARLHREGCEEEEVQLLDALKLDPNTPQRDGTTPREHEDGVAPVKGGVKAKRDVAQRMGVASAQKEDSVDGGAVLTPQAPPMEHSPGVRLSARINGAPPSVFEDSSLSEVSDDEARFAVPKKTKGKVAGQADVLDDFDELTQSSDTGTEDADSPTSGYRNASQLIQQLDHTSIDSVSLVKVQNMFHEYERTVRRERGRAASLLEKVSQLEEERASLKQAVKETREAQASLEHSQVELETELSNLRFALKQEQERHRSTSLLYEKSREQLRLKEEQHRAEAEERHKLELAKSSMELELRALASSMKQLEDDHSETQRMLTYERNTRAVQEGILNSHLRKQKEIEEETKKSVSETAELSALSGRDTELVQENQRLQEEVTVLKLELERARAHSRQEEGRLSEENEVLRERLADARRDLKLSEETLAQTVYQLNSQVAALKTDVSVTAAKLEQERQARERLEAEAEAARTRLSATMQEVERSQASRAEAERALQRERADWQRAQEKREAELSGQRQAVDSLSQQLAKAEAKANSLENECHRATLLLTEKGVLLDALRREKEEAQARTRELESALHAEREQVTRATARQEATQERLAQALSEAVLLRQQAEEAHNKGVVKERAATDAQERFGELLDRLRADSEERVKMVEERSRELLSANSELREQLGKKEQERAERETTLRHLQQELADALKKLSMSEASLEVNSRYRSDLEEEKTRMQKEMERLREKLQDSEERHLQTERRVHELRAALDERERELITSSEKLQESLATAAATERAVRQLEDSVQRLEIDNARLEASARHQAERAEALHKSAQEASAVRGHLEDLVMNLQGSKMNLEDQLSREVQKQNVLSHNAQDSHRLWEDELNMRSRLSLRLAELEKEKGELSKQIEIEKKKVKKISEQKKSSDVRLDQEMRRSAELQKDVHRLKNQVKLAKRKLREQEGAEPGSLPGVVRGEPGHRHADTEHDDRRMKTRVDELSLQLDRQKVEFRKLETLNMELKEQLSSLKALSGSSEEQERTKRRLEEEVISLRRQMDSCMMDRGQAEQYRREAEERVRKEVQQKLEEVNFFLQTQAASQDALEQMRAANEVSLRAQLDRRIHDLESELSRVRSAQQDSVSQRESAQAELQRYRELYGEELRLRKSLVAKLDRANERLAETNARLLSERQRGHAPLTSSIANGSFASPSVDMGLLSSEGPFGASRGPFSSVVLGGSYTAPGGSEQNTSVEAYLAKMQRELEKNISKELDKATVELEGRAARMSPVGSAASSQRRFSLDQDPVARATQQYLEVLKKNYKI